MASKMSGIDLIISPASEGAKTVTERSFELNLLEKDWPIILVERSSVNDFLLPWDNQ